MALKSLNKPQQELGLSRQDSSFLMTKGLGFGALQMYFGQHTAPRI
jgi:hypothetical protein